jgi:hypothetical protein
MLRNVLFEIILNQKETMATISKKALVDRIAEMHHVRLTSAKIIVEPVA